MRHKNFISFKVTATTEFYTLSLHDALPISGALAVEVERAADAIAKQAEVHASAAGYRPGAIPNPDLVRSEEHTSELQSRLHLVCRLLLEKKKIDSIITCTYHLNHPKLT